VIETMLGNGMAHKVALDEEYDWQPNSGFVRAGLADMLIPNVDLDALGQCHIVRYEGDKGRWEVEVEITSKLSQAVLRERIEENLVDGHWTHATAAAGTDGASSRWSFTGEGGAPWTGSLGIEPVAGGDHRYTVSLGVARAG
jgi:hypothetical protein